MRNPSCSSAAVAAGTTTRTTTTTTTPCCSKVGLKRGPWTPEEDELLSNYINKDGEGKWRTLPKRAGLLRCGKSCRLRWMNYLRPSVKRGRISPDEEDLILRLHRLLGNRSHLHPSLCFLICLDVCRWALIAGRIPGRTDNEIKNYWNTHLSKKLISQGIDPRSHKPLLDVGDKNKRKSPSSSISSKAVSAPPNPDPNPIPAQSEESSGTQSDQLLIQINSTTVGFGFDCQPNLNPNDGLNDILPSSIIGANHGFDFATRGRPGSQEDQREDDHDPGYCTDEVFSSFLNSIIDEDIFSCQAQQEQLPNFDALLAQPTTSTALAFGATGWDAPPLMSATTSSATALAAFHHSLPDGQPQ